ARAEQARPAPGGRERRVEEERGRRLAARPGYPGHLELVGRSAEELVRRDGHRGAGVGHDELRNPLLERALDDEGDRSALDRLVCEIMAVGAPAGDAEEEC